LRPLRSIWKWCTVHTVEELEKKQMCIKTTFTNTQHNINQYFCRSRFFVQLHGRVLKVYREKDKNNLFKYLSQKYLILNTFTNESLEQICHISSPNQIT
jgi:hypothetical protein